MWCMSIIGIETMGLPLLYPPVCAYDSQSNATIVSGDLTHLTTVPPAFPNAFIPVKCFVIYSSIRSSIHSSNRPSRQRWATLWETTECWGQACRWPCPWTVGWTDRKGGGLIHWYSLNIQYPWSGYIKLLKRQQVKDHIPFIQWSSSYLQFTYAHILMKVFLFF